MAASCDPHGDTLQRQADFEGMLSEGLVNVHHGCLRSKLGDQDFPYEDTKYYNRNYFAKYIKESWAFLKNHKTMYQGLDTQTMELMGDILSKAEQKDDIGLYALGLKALTTMSPHANIDNVQWENYQVDHNGRKKSHPPNSCLDNSGVTTEVSVSRENGCKLKNMQPEFTGVWKEMLQQKDMENQQIVQLLLLKQRELMEMSKLRKVEAELMIERLKCEEQRNLEISKKFNHVLEDMGEQVSMAKSKNEDFIRQLRAILAKYERLKKRTNSIKKHLAEERTERKSCQKALKKKQQMTEELLMNQALLQELRDTVKREYSEHRENMKTTEEHYKLFRRLEEERSSMKADYGALKDQLSNTKGTIEKLTQALLATELKKKQAEKSEQEFQSLVTQLQGELNDCKMQRKITEEQLDKMKKELKLIYERYKVKTLQLQDQRKSFMEESEAKKIECEALNEVVAKLKKDKHDIQAELECLQKEKAKSELESKRVVERMREAASLLEHERKLLLDEMGDLRKDYFCLSDRITQRLEQLEQTDVPMSITDISSSHQIRTSNACNTVSQFPSHHNTDSKYDTMYVI